MDFKIGPYELWRETSQPLTLPPDEPGILGSSRLLKQGNLQYLARGLACLITFSTITILPKPALELEGF